MNITLILSGWTTTNSFTWNFNKILIVLTFKDKSDLTFFASSLLPIPCHSCASFYCRKKLVMAFLKLVYFQLLILVLTCTCSFYTLSVSFLFSASASLLCSRLFSISCISECTMISDHYYRGQQTSENLHSSMHCLVSLYYFHDYHLHHFMKIKYSLLTSFPIWSAYSILLGDCMVIGIVLYFCDK